MYNLQGLNLLFSGHWCRDHNGTNIDLQNPVRYVQHGALYTCIMYIVYYALCSSTSSSSSSTSSSSSSTSTTRQLKIYSLVT